MNIIVTYDKFYTPVERAIRELGADVDLVLAALNDELVASTVKVGSCTASIRVTNNTKGEATIRTKDGRIAKRASTPLTRLAQVNDWAIAGGEMFVGMSLTFPPQIAQHLESAKYRKAEEPVNA